MFPGLYARESGMALPAALSKMLPAHSWFDLSAMFAPFPHWQAELRLLPIVADRVADLLPF